MTQSRRDFLVRTTCAALSASAIQGTVRQWGLANLLATPNTITPNYRALVCVFLNGGNDCNNMVIPTGRRRTTAVRLVPHGAADARDPAGQHPADQQAAGDGRGPDLRLPPQHGRDAGPLQREQARGRDQRRPARRADDPGRSTWPTRLPSPTPSSRTPTRSRPGSRAAPTSRSGRAGAAARPTPSPAATAAASGFPTITSISGSATFCVGLKRPLSIGTGSLTSVLVLNGFNGHARVRALARAPWTTCARSTPRPR